MVSYLTTLFLGKPPKGSLPVLSAHSFATNFLNQQKREIIFPLTIRLKAYRIGSNQKLFVRIEALRPSQQFVGHVRTFLWVEQVLSNDDDVSC